MCPEELCDSSLAAQNQQVRVFMMTETDRELLLETAGRSLTAHAPADRTELSASVKVFTLNNRTTVAFLAGKVDSGTVVVLPLPLGKTIVGRSADICPYADCSELKGIVEGFQWIVKIAAGVCEIQDASSTNGAIRIPGRRIDATRSEPWKLLLQYPEFAIPSDSAVDVLQGDCIANVFCVFVFGWMVT